MQFIKEVKALLKKELLLEWRQKYAINGLLLYVLSMVFVISLSFSSGIEAHTWNIIFWIILLFVSINAIAKSFLGESTGQMIYLYTLAGPHAVIAAKMIYNSLLLISVGLITWLAYQFFSPQEIINKTAFLITLLLGSFGFASNLTLVSAIAAKAQNKTTLLAVMSFPLTIPMLLTAIKASRKSMEGAGLADLSSELMFLGAFIVIIALVSFILFPFLWKD